MISITVTRNDFPRIASRLDRGVQDALDNAVNTTIEVADPLTRRDTGNLVANKTIEVGAEHRVINWNASYSAYQNGGTRYISGTHFADIGAEAGATRLEDDLVRVFR